MILTYSSYGHVSHWIKQRLYYDDTYVAATVVGVGVVACDPMVYNVVVRVMVVVVVVVVPAYNVPSSEVVPVPSHTFVVALQCVVGVIDDFVHADFDYWLLRHRHYHQQQHRHVLCSNLEQRMDGMVVGAVVVTCACEDCMALDSTTESGVVASVVVVDFEDMPGFVLVKMTDSVVKQLLLNVLNF